MKKKIEGFEDEKELKIFEDGLKNKNELIFHFWKISLNLALRVSDTLKITIEEANQYLKNGYYISKDKKTRKTNQVALNKNCIKSIKRALEIRENIKLKVDNEFLFVGQGNRATNNKNHISRISIHNIYTEVADYYNLRTKISTHTARKTWGLIVYKKTNNISLVMKRLNHSSERMTLEYIGLTQKKMDDTVIEFNL